MKSNKNAVIPFNSADIISRQLKVSRNDLVAAVQSAHVELVAQLNSLTQFEQQLGIAPNEGENGGGGETKRGPGRPKGSKNKGPGRPKTKRGPGRPKKAKGPGRPKAKRGPGRPKGSGVKRKSVKGGATASRRGRKAKNPNGMTMRDAVSNTLRNSTGPVKAAAIAEILKGQGFTSKSLSTQVAQELSRMVNDGLASRPERGSYAWSGGNAAQEQTAEVAQTA
jgi:hypothetical protein